MRLGFGNAIALLSTAALAACSGSAPSAPSPSPGLSVVERALVLQQVVAAAVSGLVGGSLGQRDSVPLGNLTCEKTCSGGSCTVTCPIDEQLACPSGGTATDRGKITGVLDASVSGDAALEAAQGYSGCKPNAWLAIDGAPGTTATGTAHFVNGQLADQQTVRVAGTVRYTSGEKSGTCPVDLIVTFSRALHGSASGSACGESVSESF